MCSSHLWISLDIGLGVNMKTPKEKYVARVARGMAKAREYWPLGKQNRTKSGRKKEKRQ
jgi:hypothetical protein